jgi:hypothetical protein
VLAHGAPLLGGGGDPAETLAPMAEPGYLRLIAYDLAHLESAPPPPCRQRRRWRATLAVRLRVVVMPADVGWPRFARIFTLATAALPRRLVSHRLTRALIAGFIELSAAQPRVSRLDARFLPAGLSTRLLRLARRICGGRSSWTVRRSELRMTVRRGSLLVRFIWPFQAAGGKVPVSAASVRARHAAWPGAGPRRPEGFGSRKASLG